MHLNPMPTIPPGFRGRFHRHESERALVSQASGILTAMPDAVAVPADADDVGTLVRWAAATKTPLVPRGAGTGMPGGNVGSGVVIDLVSDFRSVGEVDISGASVQVQPGVTLAQLNLICASAQLRFPVDPSSGARCTLGGMLANNSAGAHSVKYGATRAWVEALDLVLPDGSRAQVARGKPIVDQRLREIAAQVDARLRPQQRRVEELWPRVRKNSSGYALREYLASGDLLDLLIGSEGTLALITGASLRLGPLPAAQGLALLEFTNLERAGAAVQTLLELEPSTCEMLDRTFLELVRAAGADAGYPLREGLEAILLVEVEGASLAEVDERLEGICTAMTRTADHISTATDPAQQQRYWDVRHAASPLIAKRTDGRVSMQFIEDGVVPIHRLPDYVVALRRILANHGVPAVIFGHAGDGNLHVNPLVDVSAPQWRSTIERILYEVAAEVAALGGTLAGEHGDGRLRAPLLETIWGPEIMELFRAVKTAFDPDGILNPGVLLPLPGQRPLDALRDYAMPALFESPPPV
jgi:FAD/FMN-containing dehydrogenase